MGFKEAYDDFLKCHVQKTKGGNVYGGCKRDTGMRKSFFY